jgi:hypothetical protein
VSASTETMNTFRTRAAATLGAACIALGVRANQERPEPPPRALDGTIAGELRGLVEGQSWVINGTSILETSGRTRESTRNRRDAWRAAFTHGEIDLSTVERIEEERSRLHPLSRDFVWMPDGNYYQYSPVDRLATPTAMNLTQQEAIRRANDTYEYTEGGRTVHALTRYLRTVTLDQSGITESFSGQAAANSTGFSAWPDSKPQSVAANLAYMDGGASAALALLFRLDTLTAEVTLPRQLASRRVRNLLSMPRRSRSKNDSHSWRAPRENSP